MGGGKRTIIRRLIPVVLILVAAAVWMFGRRRIRDADAIPPELQVPQPATILTTRPEYPATSPVIDPRSRTGRLASWNINFGNRRVEQVAAELENVDADIVCLQETTRQSEDFLVSALKVRYPHYQSFGHQGNYFAERFLVLSKNPWRSIRYLPPSRTFFGCVVMEATFCGTPVTVVSVHLAPFTANGVDSLAGLYSAMGHTEVDHQHEIQAALEHVSLKDPVVILGDFNSLAGMVAPRTLKEAGLVDAFETLTPDADQIHRTWHWPIQGAGELRLRIDYVFHSTHFKPTTARVVPCQHSDHDLLVVDFARDSDAKDRGTSED